jgi:hypothetical protein
MAPRSLTQDLTGATFRFSLKEWRQLQRSFRAEWKLNASGSPEEIVYGLAPKEKLIRRKSGLEYQTETLWRLLFFSLDSIPFERLRVCDRPDCPNPYFVARHLGQRYCSQVCAQWAQREWKKKWWVSHGPDWRKQHSESTRKARGVR